MNDKTDNNEAATVPIAVVAALKNDTTVFSVCRNEDDGTLFMQAADFAHGQGVILFTKAEDLRQFGRAIIKAANSVSN